LCTKEDHVEEVGGAAPEAALLQQAAVAHEKKHVEKEVEAEGAKEEEVGEEAPDLIAVNPWSGVGVRSARLAGLSLQLGRHNVHGHA